MKRRDEMPSKTEEQEHLAAARSLYLIFQRTLEHSDLYMLS